MSDRTETAATQPFISADETMEGARTHKGGCHCGKVRYEAKIDLSQGSGQCNCSICTKTANWGAIIKPQAFTLLSGEDSLRDYQFNTKVGHHLFCSHCGVRAFGRGNIPQIGGEYVSINLRCLEDVDLSRVPIKHFDGRHNNWQ